MGPAVQEGQESHEHNTISDMRSHRSTHTIKSLPSMSESERTISSFVTTSHEECAFFLDMDVHNFISFLEVDEYGMIDIVPSARRIRQMRSLRPSK
jgi:hypothetical protein